MSYKDSFAFNFTLNCLVTSVVCILIHLSLTNVQYYAWFTRFRSTVPSIPIRSTYLIMFIAGLFGGFLLLISPVGAFLYLGHQDAVPLIKMSIFVGTIFAALSLMTPTRCSLSFVLSCMSLIEVALCCSQLIQMPSMFNYTREESVGIISLLSAIPFWVVIVYILSKVQQEDKREIWWKASTLVFRSSFFWIAAISATVLSVIVSSLQAGTCIAPFGESLEGSKIFFSDCMFINTRALRYPHCTQPVCHVYLTAGEDLTSSVFINIHSQTSTQVVDIKMDDLTLHTTQVLASSLSGLDSQDDRNVFNVFLSDLVPGKDYEFQVVTAGATEQEAKTFKFRLPRSDAIKMSVGGDAGVTQTSRKIFQLMYASNPDLIVIGGDMAYDNGLAACACLWDAFLDMIDFRTPDGRLVPMTFAVGNHDIGYNHANKGGWQARTNPIPLLFSWFPFADQVPVEKRSMNRRHRLGDNFNLWMLDSDYTSSLEDVVGFVDSSLAKQPSSQTDTVNIGVYHVPIYSVHVHDYHRGDEMRNIWPSRIFDKHKFFVNFENHSHLYKRTKPLIDSRLGPGTVYLGDGNIGVTEDRFEAEEFLQKSDDRFVEIGVDFHFFSVSVSQGGHVVVDTINPLGRVIDHVEVHGYGNVSP